MPIYTTIQIGQEALRATVVLSRDDRQLCYIKGKGGKAALFYEATPTTNQRPRFLGALQPGYARLFEGLIEHSSDTSLNQQPGNKTRLKTQQRQARRTQHLKELLERVDPELPEHIRVIRKRGIVWTT